MINSRDLWPCCLPAMLIVSTGLMWMVELSPIKIGVLLNEVNLDDEVALNFSFDFANRVLFANHSALLVDVHRSHLQTEIGAIQNVCSQISRGVAALIGILNSPLTRTVSVMAAAYRVPLFAPKVTNPFLVSTTTFPYLIRTSPPDSLQSEAIADMIKYFGWTRMTILTDSSDGVAGLVRLQVIASIRQWKTYSVRRFQSARNGSEIDARPQLLSIKQSGVRIIVLHCAASEGLQVLKQAVGLAMTTAGWQWIVTNPIVASDRTLNSNDTLVGLQGLLGTAFRVKPSAFFSRVLQDWTEKTDRQEITSSQGLIMDAVFSIAYAAMSFPLKMFRETPDNGSSPVCSMWSQGEHALAAFTQVSGDGVMGRIEYEDHQPKAFTYDLVSLIESNWQKVGEWRSDYSSDQRLKMFNKTILKMGAVDTIADFVSTLANQSLRVVFMTEPGFIDLKPGFTHAYLKNFTAVPVEWLEGYCIDLFLKLQEAIGFNFSLYLVPDEAFGRKDEVTGEWNGMVRELVGRRADMAVASMTISRLRKTEIDFTAPYIDLGLQFTLKRSSLDPFRFLAPLSSRLWGFILATLVIVSLIVTLINKLSPYDYHGGFAQEGRTMSRGRKRSGKSEKKKHFSAINFNASMWISFATLLQQGPDTLPLSPSARVTSSVWFFSVLILVATYTANMSAYLTQSRLQSEVNSLEGLVNQPSIRYGVVQSSSTFMVFAESSDPLYQGVYSSMKKLGTTVENTDEGIRRAREGGYAFIHDSLVLEYEAQKPPCELRMGGKTFGKLGYGFGLQKNSPFREELSIHITQLREQGFLANLKKKWLAVPNGCDESVHPAQTDVLSRLGVNNVFGMFYIIYVGLGLSLVVLAVEWMLACAVDARNPLLPFKTWNEAFRWRRTRITAELVEHARRWFCQPPSSSRNSASHIQQSKDENHLRKNRNKSFQLPNIATISLESAAIHPTEDIATSVPDDRTPREEHLEHLDSSR